MVMRALVISSALVATGIAGAGYYSLRETSVEPAEVVIQTTASLSDVTRGARELPTTPRNTTALEPLNFDLPSTPEALGDVAGFSQVALAIPRPDKSETAIPLVAVATDITTPSPPLQDEAAGIASSVTDQTVDGRVQVALIQPNEARPVLPAFGPTAKEPEPLVVAAVNVPTAAPTLPDVSLQPNFDDIETVALPDANPAPVNLARPQPLVLTELAPEAPRSPTIATVAAPEVADAPVTPDTDVDDVNIAALTQPALEAGSDVAVSQSTDTAPDSAAPALPLETTDNDLPAGEQVAVLSPDVADAPVAPSTTGEDVDVAALAQPTAESEADVVVPQTAEAAPEATTPALSAETAREDLPEVEQVAALSPVPNLDETVETLPGVATSETPEALPDAADATPRLTAAAELHEALQTAALPLLPEAGEQPVIDLSALETLGQPTPIVALPEPDVAQEDEVIQTAAIAPVTPADIAPVVPDVGETDAPAPSEALQQVVYVTGSRVNLREGPSTDFSVVTVEDLGSKLRVIETQGRWTRVASDDNEYQGWMSSRYLASTKPEPRAVPQRVARNEPSNASNRQTNRATASTRRQSSASSAQARRAIIRRALLTSSAECPCPFSRDRAGNLCGGNSVWNRNGGGGQICFDGDVTPSMIQRWLARNG